MILGKNKLGVWILNTSPLRVKILGVYGIFDCLPRGGRNVVTFSLYFYTKENFIIERTGVCVWFIGKKSSQNIRKAILLQLESSWMVEKLKCSFARSVRKWYSFFQEYLRIHNKNSTRPKKGEIFRIILRIFFNLLLEDHAAAVFFVYKFFFSLTVKSAILSVVNYSAKKKKRNIWNTRLLDLKLRLKIVLQNYLIFAQRGFSGPRSNPGLEEVFLLILSLSLTNSCLYRDCTNWTPGTC